MNEENLKAQQHQGSILEIRGPSGRILDIGGGGEGVIGRIFGSLVTAIDNRLDELQEAPDDPSKLVMGASNLAFSDGSFDCITAFFSFMFIEKSQHLAVFHEARRVLRPGGRFLMWDAAIDRADDEPFLTDVNVRINDGLLHVTYGVQKEDARQNADGFIRLAAESGFHSTIVENIGGHFHLGLVKTQEEPSQG